MKRRPRYATEDDGKKKTRKNKTWFKLFSKVRNWYIHFQHIPSNYTKPTKERRVKRKANHQSRQNLCESIPKSSSQNLQHTKCSTIDKSQSTSLNNSSRCVPQSNISTLYPHYSSLFLQEPSVLQIVLVTIRRCQSTIFSFFFYKTIEISSRTKSSESSLLSDYVHALFSYDDNIPACKHKTNDTSIRKGVPSSGQHALIHPKDENLPYSIISNNIPFKIVAIHCQNLHSSSFPI